jgi:hypothetical protein
MALRPKQSLTPLEHQTEYTDETPYSYPTVRRILFKDTPISLTRTPADDTPVWAVYNDTRLLMAVQSTGSRAAQVAFQYADTSARNYRKTVRIARFLNTSISRVTLLPSSNFPKPYRHFIDADSPVSCEFDCPVCARLASTKEKGDALNEL